jgi:hypothetical protein
VIGAFIPKKLKRGHWSAPDWILNSGKEGQDTFKNDFRLGLLDRLEIG